MRYTFSMLIRLSPAARIRAAFHVLRTGDYQPANAYLRGHRDGLNNGLDMAWREFQQHFPEMKPTPKS